ncbi:MAG TPA: hypothetical protein VN761_09165 [Candidatus Polarisedimenticolia bacterium]|nr:hypothetical protein [Candidatus Polarisedimenticolia bacterium]
MKEITVIAHRASEKNLPLLVAGGLAVEVHGYERRTFDADLVIRRTDRDKWLELMLELGFSVFLEGPVFLQLIPPEAGQLPPVDLMFMTDETFGKLAALAIPNPYGSDLPNVVSLESLVAMKCHAIRHGHPGRVVKDADDLIHLFMANRLDPEAEKWRELILKFGTEELYEKLRRICKAGEGS